MGDQLQRHGLRPRRSGLVEPVQDHDQARSLHLKPFELAGHALTQQLSQLRAGRAELASTRVQELASLLNLLRECAACIRRTVQDLQPRGRTLSKGEQRVSVLDLLVCAANLPTGSGQLAATVLDPRQPGRVRVQASQVLTQLGRHISRLDRQALNPRPQLAQRLVHLRDRRNRTLCLCQQ